MFRRPHVFRRAAVERYAARRDSLTLPKLQPPKRSFPAVLFLVVTLSISAGVTFVSIPVHTTASIIAAGASVVEIAPVPSEPPYAVGQRVFVRRKADGVVIGRGTVVRVLASSAAEARLDTNLSSLSLPTSVVIVETGRETLLQAIAERVDVPLAQIN